MSRMILTFAAVYGALNVFVFAMYGIDKLKAIRGSWRIPEGKLLLAAVFGVFGALLGMLIFRHKIRKPRFFIGVPAILVIELLLFIVLAVRLSTP